MLWQNPFQKADAKLNQQPPTPTPDTKNQQTTKSGLTPEDQTPNPDNSDNKNKTGDEGDDPMLKFETLWEPNKDAEGKVIEDTSNEPTTYMPKIDATKFGAMLEKMDFTKNISQEERKAIEAGGEGAVNAMMGVLNKSHRHSFATMMNATNKMVEGAFQGAQEKFMKSIPDHVRDMMVTTELSGSNPLMTNPAFKPTVEGVRKQFQGKYPKANPNEITKAVNAYFDKMYADMTTHKNKGQDASKTKNNATKLREGTNDADFVDWIAEEVGLKKDNDQTLTL